MSLVEASDAEFERGLRIWATRVGDEVVTCLTSTPKHYSEKLSLEQASYLLRDDTRYVERLMRFLKTNRNLLQEGRR